jgi:hypothetical protein
MFWWQGLLFGCIALGALACGQVSLDQPRPDAAPSDPARPDAAPSDAAPSDPTPIDAAQPDADRPDALPPVNPGPCDPATGRVIGCACSADTQCASGNCIDDRCCEDACDDGCASCNAEGLCESHPGRLRVSASPDRANDVPLAGQSLAGAFYAFAETCEPMDEVRFFYDMSAILHTDTAAPFDFGGGSAGVAGHHSNIEFPKGTHALRVELVLGTTVVDTLQESFVMETSPFDETLLYSQDNLRSDPRPLANATLSGNVFIFLAPGPMPADRVGLIGIQFLLDGTQVRNEVNPPYDIAGGNATAQPFNTANLANGSHLVETVYVVDGVTRRATASFNVAN